MNIQQAIQYGLNALSTISDSARLDAELLLCHTLHCQRIYLYAHSETVLSHQQDEAYREWIALRAQSIPIAFLLGEKEFWSLNLKLSTQTLIPRPATEALVAHILELQLAKQAHILDLGTGSGAIALSLAYERPQWKIIATDIQANALAIAAKNAKIHYLDNIQFLWSNWFTKVPQKKFDLIVSNPPYINSTDTHLSEGDVQYESSKALISANEGYADLMLLTSQAKKYLRNRGVLILEHGSQQQDQLIDILTKAGYQEIQGFKDQDGLDRFCRAIYRE